MTINLPRNDHLVAMEIGIEDDAIIKRAPDYSLEKPIVFYGSSITEGGCAPRAGIAYTSILGRWLDCDYRNKGFSGLACGEQVFAEYLRDMDDMSVFVCDYDHNAPDAKHLKETHEAFYQTIRSARPKLPIVMMTKPDSDPDLVDAQMMVYQTYEKARRNGDQKLWFVDGQQFFGLSGRAECTVDGTHPNALGFMRMAETLYPLLRHIIDKEIEVD